MTSGRAFLQIPGPTNVPERILRAIARPVIDHRSGEFANLVKEILPPLRTVFGTAAGSLVIYPSSGTGASEAALVNVLSPGDRVLVLSNGQFSARFASIARDLRFDVDEVSLRWGQAASGSDLETRLESDHGSNRYRAVVAVQNETSTGVESDVGSLRNAIDAAHHDALLIIDAVSALGSVPFRFDDWGVDICVTASQKGLMLPPGLGLLCVGARALEASKAARSPRSFFDWRPILRDNVSGFFPYTPATSLLFGLHEALQMLVVEEGLDNVFQRHMRLASGVRAAVGAWSLPLVCEDPAFASQTLTAICVPEGTDSADVVSHARQRFGLSLGMGLGLLKGKAFRIGHLGSLNELEVLGTLAGVEITLTELGVGTQLGAGVAACERSFATSAAKS